MYARDWNTSSYAIQGFDAMNASYFQGTPYAPSDANGFFTGPMTEWYHGDPSYRDSSQVTYTTNLAVSSAWMWMDQFDQFNPFWNGDLDFKYSGSRGLHTKHHPTPHVLVLRRVRIQQCLPIHHRNNRASSQPPSRCFPQTSQPSLHHSINSPFHTSLMGSNSPRMPKIRLR